MSLQKHNRWSRLIPPGFTCTDLKNRLRLTTLTKLERSVCRFILDQADPTLFTVTAGFIASSLDFSLEKTWPRVRNQLAEKGLIVWHRQPRIPFRPVNYEVLPNGEKRWHLNFDFTPLASGLFDREAEKLSTRDSKKRGSRAHACDPPILGGSRNPIQSGGSRDPAALGGFEPEALAPEKPTSKAAAFLLIEKQECLVAVTSAEKNRIAAALGSAGEDQINTFISVFSARLGRAEKPVGLAVHLAQLASRGELALDAPAPPMLAPAAGSGSATDVCAAKSTWRGYLRGPVGVVAEAKLDAGMGQLRSPNGSLFSIADSSIFWLRVDEGGLDFVGI